MRTAFVLLASFAAIAGAVSASAQESDLTVLPPPSFRSSPSLLSVRAKKPTGRSISGPASVW